jgi:hypothetical protein
MKQTATEYLFEKLWETPKDKLTWNAILEQALEMEKQQHDKTSEDWWNEGASYMHDGKTKYPNFKQYYKETYEQ